MLKKPLSFTVQDVFPVRMSGVSLWSHSKISLAHRWCNSSRTCVAHRLRGSAGAIVAGHCVRREETQNVRFSFVSGQEICGESSCGARGWVAQAVRWWPRASSGRLRTERGRERSILVIRLEGKHENGVLAKNPAGISS